MYESTQQLPQVLALILAEGGYWDAATNKYFILGALTSLQVYHLPWTQPNLSVYAAVTDGRGSTQFTFRIVDLNGGYEPVSQVSFELDMTDPIQVLEIGIQLRSLVFPVAGEYVLQMEAAREFLLERRIDLLLKLPPDLAEDRDDS